ncbi:hypothetical protein SORBI_3005G177025 [Sorghum bicolor]|uniref:Uncharacterized protein n=1 Tax=Sorghum bicolor TaxID=4558 RepID=A0A1Z5RJR3_SORBI|nr:hypothetical protein SORBI_3005G177025 [Sorghum bicolor]
MPRTVPANTQKYVTKQAELASLAPKSREDKRSGRPSRSSFGPSRRRCSRSRLSPTVVLLPPELVRVTATPPGARPRDSTKARICYLAWSSSLAAGLAHPRLELFAVAHILPTVAAVRPQAECMDV